MHLWGLDLWLGVQAILGAELTPRLRDLQESKWAWAVLARVGIVEHLSFSWLTGTYSLGA